MAIFLAESDADILSCYPVMRQLRPHIAEEAFLPRVRRQQAAGYRLAALAVDGVPVALAGFRIGESLSWGRFLYVDDLVTDAACRSRGHGSALLVWLADLARREGCRQLHLDSGVQRLDAHRFYRREGLAQAALHFHVELGEEGGTG